jgi:hypothetical protein
LEIYFSASKMRTHLRGGPSGPFLDGFAATLERQGYSADTAVRYLRAAAHLGHVVARQGAMPTEIDLAAFSEHLRRCRCPRATGGCRNHHTIFGARLWRTGRRARRPYPSRRPILPRCCSSCSLRSSSGSSGRTRTGLLGPTPAISRKAAVPARDRVIFPRGFQRTIARCWLQVGSAFRSHR